MRRGGEAAEAAPGAAPQQSPTTEGGPELDNRLKVRERLFAFGDDFWIENARGRRTYLVDGKALRIRDTLLFKDLQGQEHYRLQEKVARVRDTMTLYKADGGDAATIHKALITPLRDRYTVDLPGQPNLETQGNILHHEYTIEQGGRPVATISKRWFRVRDTYGIEVVPNTIDPLLAVAMTVGIDMMQGAG
ncbi:MAG: LURP-one-related family protein [Chloroflexi bacterium]|nr:LURP-one-related family protein [Chloroflexota bacterium]